MIKFKKIAVPKPVTPDHEPAAPKPEQPLFMVKDFRENYITYHIHRTNAKTRAARHHNVVHASDLDPVRQWCPREPALLTQHDKKRPSTFISTAQSMTFRMGYKGADLLMQTIPPEKVWGNWQCRACKFTHKFQYTPKHCGGCGGEAYALKYQEVFLRDPETGIVGSVDLFVDILGNGTKTPVEIKTEGNEGFKARTKPEFDHEWRTMLYLWLISRDPHMEGHNLNDQEGRVIYFTKEGYADEPKIKEWGLADWKKSAIKEYWVNANPDMIANGIDLARSYRKWRNVWDKTKGQTAPALPPRIEKCSSVTCTRAKNCPVRKECWL